MKKGYLGIIIVIVSILFLGSLSFAKKENISYSAIFSSNKEFADQDISSPNFVEYSTAINVSKRGKINSKKVYKGISINEGFKLQNDKIFLSKGFNDDVEVFIGINKNNLSFTDYFVNSFEGIKSLDKKFMYSYYGMQENYMLRRVNLDSTKSDVLEIEEDIESMGILENTIYIVSRKNDRYSLHEIDKGSLEINNKVEIKAKEDLEKFYDYNFFTFKENVYFCKSTFNAEDNKYEAEFFNYNSNSKKLKKIKMKDIGITSNISKRDFINTIKSETRDKGNIYYMPTSKKLIVLNKKSGNIKKYKVPKKTGDEIRSPEEYYKIKDGLIYYVKEITSKNKSVPKYEIREYNFKKQKITRKVKVKNGAKNKKDYLKLIDFSVK